MRLKKKKFNLFYDESYLGHSDTNKSLKMKKIHMKNKK